MGVIVNKDNNQNDELSRRINADLRAKAVANSDIAGNPDPDLAEDAEYVKDLNITGVTKEEYYNLLDKRQMLYDYYIC